MGRSTKDHQIMMASLHKENTVVLHVDEMWSQTA